MVICVVGQPSAGKDTAAEYLEKKYGFVHFSMGDFIREEMKKEGLPLNRESINKYVIEKRKKFGVGYPAEKVVDLIGGREAVISGMRNVAEYNIFKDKLGKDFIILAVEGEAEMRWKRAMERGREGDNISFEKFLMQEEKEKGGTKWHEMDKVIELADYRINNNRSRDDFFKKIEEIIGVIKNNI